MDLRRRAGELLARVRYAGERFIIEKNGEPTAALIGIDDLRRLEASEGHSQQEHTLRRQALDMAQAVRESVLARRGGESLPDIVDEVRRMREERSRDLAGLR
jgi:prevent-host-death family protein